MPLLDLLPQLTQGGWANCNAQVINDLDAGAGRFTDTQVTVNNQMVSGTLMNLCDDPHQVPLPIPPSVVHRAVEFAVEAGL